MSFNVLSLSHAPDADKNIHRSEIDTGSYRLFTVVVKDQAEALEVARKIVETKEIHNTPLPRIHPQGCVRFSEAFRRQGRCGRCPRRRTKQCHICPDTEKRGLYKRLIGKNVAIPSAIQQYIESQMVAIR